MPKNPKMPHNKTEWENVGLHCWFHLSMPFLPTIMKVNCVGYEANFHLSSCGLFALWIFCMQPPNYPIVAPLLLLTHTVAPCSNIKIALLAQTCCSSGQSFWFFVSSIERDCYVEEIVLCLGFTIKILWGLWWYIFARNAV